MTSELLQDECEENVEVISQSKVKRGRFPKLEKLVALQLDAEKRIYAGASDRDAAALMRAWKELELLRRIMLNRPIQVLPVQAKLPKARKFGMLRSVSAEIVDVEATPKAVETPLETVAPVLQSDANTQKHQ